MAIRVKALRLVGASASGPSYEVSFRPPGAKDGYRPLSVIAGPSLTGKTTIIDFIAYCLGGSYLPRHDEVQARVRGALLEVDLGNEPAVIERAAAGGPSTFATVWRSNLEGVGDAAELRMTIEPTGDPDGLSQFVLASSGLAGVRLMDSATKEETGSAMLSIRDVFRVMIITNSRLDNQSLVYEHDQYMVTQKYRQTIDVMFGVYDNEEALLAEQQRNAAAQRNSAQQRLDALLVTAERDHPEGVFVLQKQADELSVQITDLTVQLRTLDSKQRSTESASAEIRRALAEAQDQAAHARVRVRDRDSLLQRLNALRDQYADDRRKLSFLLDAEALFDPLRVTSCPACFNRLETSPSIEAGECSLCHHPIEADKRERSSPLSTDSRGESPQLVRNELRAVKSRLSSLTEYIAKLTTHAGVLEREADAAEKAASSVALAVDKISDSPAPWLALRDRLTDELMEARLALQSARAGLRAWSWVDQAAKRVDELQTQLDRLSKSRRRARPAREQVVRDLSERFAHILEEIGYPKLRDAYISNNLIPYVRGIPYTEASSGGMVIIALAWNLALWEVAFEQNADAPGLLIIDSPQKNLGHNAANDDDFADAALVERFYAHVKRWLTGPGTGAQLIVVDNSPPESVENDVVVRFTRSADEYPYGLIWDATT